MRIRRLGWWELAIFVIVTAGVVTIILVKTSDVAWRVLSFPFGLFVALFIAYWGPESVRKIKKMKHDKLMQRRAKEARLHPRPL